MAGTNTGLRHFVHFQGCDLLCMQISTNNMWISKTLSQEILNISIHSGEESLLPVCPGYLLKA